MEDLFYDESAIRALPIAGRANVDAVNNLVSIMKDRLHSNFRFLCGVRNVIEVSSQGPSILKGNANWQLVKYSYLGSYDCSVSVVLNKLFGFTDRYIDYLVKIINKFLRTKNAEDVFIEKSKEESDSDCCAGLTYVLDFFEYLSISKMQELLPLSIEQIRTAFERKELTVRSTVKEIRAYVKALSGGTVSKVVEDNSEEEQRTEVRKITEEFDPTKEYDTSFFDELDKQELVYCCLRYQQEILNLKNKK